jgi:hypothetical protein
VRAKMCVSIQRIINDEGVKRIGARIPH